MKYFHKNYISVHLTTFLMLLGGCSGGNGGSSSANNPLNPVQPSNAYSQADAKIVANLGFFSSELVFNQIQSLAASFAYFTQGFLSNQTTRSPGQYSNTVSCLNNGKGSGTVSIILTVSGAAAVPARLGVILGDSISLNYVNCDFGGTGIVKNGNALIKPLGTYTSLGLTSASLNDFQFQFQLSTTDYTVTDINTVTNKSNGTQEILFSSTLSSSNITVQSKVISPLTTNYYRSGEEVPFSSNQLSSGLSYSSMRNFISNKFESSIKGTVVTGIGSPTLPLEISTISALSGNINADRVVPVDGILFTKDSNANLSTQTTWSNGSVGVSADTNKDNSYDLNFSYSSHALFIAP